MNYLIEAVLDLVLRAPGLKKIPAYRLAGFADAVCESTIPFLVEARDWAQLPDSFRREIERTHVVVMSPKSTILVSSTWRDLPFSDAVMVNPYVSLKRGNSYPHVDMALLTPGRRSVKAVAHREFRGGGSRFEPGDTLMARITPCLENGKTARFEPSVDDAAGPAHGSTEFIVLRGRNGVSDTAYVHYLAKSPEVRDFAISQMTGTSGRQRVPPDSFDHLSIAVPPLAEQRRIADILGALDDKIELNRRMNETLEAMARALFKSWFVDFEPVRAKMEGRDAQLPLHIPGLFPDRLVESVIGMVPRGWEISEIGREVTAVGGTTPSTKVDAFWTDGKHAWATPKDLSALSEPVLLDTAKRVTSAGLATISSGLLPRGTVLMSSRAPIGYLAIAETPVAVNQGFIAMVCGRRLPNIYVLLWCRENVTYIKSIAGGSTFAEISKKAFRPIPVLVPPPDLLDVFTPAVRSLYNQIVANVKQNSCLANIRDLLLPKLISGEFRVQEAEQILDEVV